VPSQKREGDYGFAAVADLSENLSFELMRDRHFAGLNFGLAGAVEAELAMAERDGFIRASVHSHRRTEDAAGHGAPLVYIATACFRIERGAGRIVCKLLKTLLFWLGFAQNTRS
jgi:hypothetical protein